MTRLETFDGSTAQLQRIYSERHVPLVIVGTGIYLPPPECLHAVSHAASAQPPASVATDNFMTPASPDVSTDKKPTDQDGHVLRAQGEERKFGGFAEQRRIGGASIPIKCVRHGADRGFEVVIPTEGDVQYFDGNSLHSAPDRFVPLK